MIALACLLARGDHAARCPRCRAAAAQDHAVRALAAAAPTPSLSPRARTDAFARALAAPVAAAGPRRRWSIVVPAGLALAAAAVFVLVIAGRGDDTAAARTALAAGETTVVGHGRVTLAAGGVAWKTGETEVTLVSGAVEIEVDPAPHRGFRVRAPRFAVDVLGTVFRVDVDGVAVSRGAVRIADPTGAVLVDRLAVGERWRVDGEVATAPAPPPVPDVAPDPALEPEEIAMTVDDVRPRRPPPDASRPVAPAAPAAAPTQTPEQVLLRARAQIAEGDAAGGRKALHALLARKPGRAIRADAEMLLAESYQDENLATAIKRYRAVADTYRDLAIGEAALYAAARLEAKVGRAAAARELFELYLERYPTGALADKARQAVGGP